MRVTRITVTDPADARYPIRDVIEMADHSDVAGLVKDLGSRWVGFRVAVEFADVMWGGSWDLRDADAGVNGGRGW